MPSPHKGIGNLGQQVLPQIPRAALRDCVKHTFLIRAHVLLDATRRSARRRLHIRLSSRKRSLSKRLASSLTGNPQERLSRCHEIVSSRALQHRRRSLRCIHRPSAAKRSLPRAQCLLRQRGLQVLPLRSL